MHFKKDCFCHKKILTFAVMLLHLRGPLLRCLPPVSGGNGRRLLHNFQRIEI
jgi:hypothetical protein